MARCSISVRGGLYGRLVRGLLCLLLAACAAEAGTPPTYSPKLLDDPACVEDLARFFSRYSSDDPDLGEWWQQTHHVLLVDGAAETSVGRQIQFSWEKEGNQQAILDWYRLPTYTDEEWMALPLTERYALITPSAYEPAWGSLVRMDTVAPWYVRRELYEEISGLWETTTDGYVTTLDALFQHAVHVRRTLGREGGFHWHVSFPLPPESYLDDYLDFAMQASEYATLRMFAGRGGVGHSMLGPLDSQRIELLREALLSRGRHGDLYDKFNTFSIRSIYQNGEGTVDRNRIGFELRSWNYDLDDARRALATTVRFLEGPNTTPIVFGTRGSGYQMSDVLAADRLGPQTFSRFPPEIQAFLHRPSENARAPLSPTLPGLTPDASRREVLRRRWAYPMVRWEERSYLPEPAARTVVSARARFIGELEALRNEPRTGFDFDTQRRINAAIRRWAIATQLWHYW